MSQIFLVNQKTYPVIKLMNLETVLSVNHKHTLQKVAWPLNEDFYELVPYVNLKHTVQPSLTPQQNDS